MNFREFLRQSILHSKWLVLNAPILAGFKRPLTTERFFASAGQCEATGDLIVKVINTSPEDVTTAIKLDGIDRLRSKAELTILKSDSLEDNNSLDNPAKVVPLTRTITGIDTDFTHTFPAYSPTVMRLKE